MRAWLPDQIARAAGARLAAGAEARDGPSRVIVDSREAGEGTLFVGLPGTQVDGGEFAVPALASGAWGVLVGEPHAKAAAQAGGGVVLAAADPLRALQSLATAWRRHLQAKVIGVTGSTGKTSTKDLLLSLLSPQRRTVASRANFNTEIGLPLEILAAPEETEVLVLEMAMRGAGQIAELAGIAQPDVGVIVNVGPVHLELLGSLEAIASAKAELIAALAPGATAVVPAGEPLLQPHLRSDLHVVTFGDAGDVRLGHEDGARVEVQLGDQRIDLEVSFAQAHLRRNLLAAVAAAAAVGVTPSGRVELRLGAGRGRRTELPGGTTLIDDCYNANPMSMRAALQDLARSAGQGRRVAVLGDMLELGPREREFHRELGAAVAEAGVDLLVTVGPLAAAAGEAFGGETMAAADAIEAVGLLERQVRPGDLILVKGSRAVGLELVCRALSEGAPVT